MSIETYDIELWKIMHKLLLMYSANYNIKYKLTGHLFENRYTARLIEDERYFLPASWEARGRGDSMGYRLH